MPSIRIGVVNPSESEKTTMSVPDDAPIGSLTDAIVDALNLPPRGNDGHRMRYQLNRRNEDGDLERLHPDETLGNEEVQEGDALYLSVEMVAGTYNLLFPSVRDVEC